MSALGLPDYTLATVSEASEGRRTLAWMVGDLDPVWESCPCPWRSTVRLSRAAWRELRADGTPAPDSQTLDIHFPSTRIPVRPARIGALLDGDEIGFHVDDARRMGISTWVFVNWDGIPAVLRARLSRNEDDRGFARLSYQTRVLLGIPRMPPGLLPELLAGPYPTDGTGHRLLVSQPDWDLPASSHWHRLKALRTRVGTWGDRAMAWLLRAPAVTLQTRDATPGEDTARTVRLPAEMFPLLGTQPGQEVYVSWGPGNRTIARALVSRPPNDDLSFPKPFAVGAKPSHLSPPPEFARIQIGAASRAALGIPRTTPVTVQRRTAPLLTLKLNELIVPVTALFIGFAADLRMPGWLVLLAGVIVLGLMVAPLRMRRPPLGRLPS